MAVSFAYKAVSTTLMGLSVSSPLQPIFPNIPILPSQSILTVPTEIETKEASKKKEIRALIDNETVTFKSEEEQFKALAKNWRRHIRGKSIINYSHPAYFQVLSMGDAAIPFLLKEVASGAGSWYIALQYITHEIPETSEMRGNAEAIRQAWLSWGLRNGYSTELAETSGND